MSDPAKLAVITGIFHPEPGGPATYLYKILPELQARAWDIRLISYSDDTPTVTYPYPVTRIPRRILPLRLLHYTLEARPLLRWADLAYVHSLDLPMLDHRAPRVVKIVGDQAWERAIRKGWIPATTDIDEFQTQTYNPTVRAQQAARSRQVCTMDGVIVPSDYLKRMVVGWGVNPAKVQVVYNAIRPLETPDNIPTISQTEARQRLNLDDRPLLLTAARLTAWKGVDHLITALQHVPDVQLLVAGDGPEYDRLVALTEQLNLQQRVQFLGRVSREQMPLYMKAAAYLALYSGYEGLSHTLLECLQMGTPVIASDKGGNPEVVRHEVNGLLVPYVDVDALIATLQTAFQPGKRDTLAANASVGLERFTFSQMVAHTDTALRAYVK